MRTGMGTRAQPMMIAGTTAGDDPAGFARSEHDECATLWSSGLPIAMARTRCGNRLAYAWPGPV